MHIPIFKGDDIIYSCFCRYRALVFNKQKNIDFNFNRFFFHTVGNFFPKYVERLVALIWFDHGD